MYPYSTSCQGYILMYTGVHLDVAWENPSFQLFDLHFDL